MFMFGLVVCVIQLFFFVLLLQVLDVLNKFVYGYKGLVEVVLEVVVVMVLLVDLILVLFEVVCVCFVCDIVVCYGIFVVYIEVILVQVQICDLIIVVMLCLVEWVKLWNEYWLMFISQVCIDGGWVFFVEYCGELMWVQECIGVLVEVIVVIIGVEISYGCNIGSYCVFDVLYMLVFKYLCSGDLVKLECEVCCELFFCDELVCLFVLICDEKLDIFLIKGSYVGVMGMGQFMLFSYLDYVVDGNGDGCCDLFISYDDVFFLIVNYFVRKGGWVCGGLVVVLVILQVGCELFDFIDWIFIWILFDLVQCGYQFGMLVVVGLIVMLIMLEVSIGKQYWLGFQNYYVIICYNFLKMYVMVVYQFFQVIVGQELLLV